MPIQFQDLLDIVKASEKQPHKLFRMQSFVRETKCGTAGCLVGSWVLQAKPSGLSVVYEPQYVQRSRRYKREAFIRLNNNYFQFFQLAKRLGITEQEAIWLFGPTDTVRARSLNMSRPSLSKVGKRAAIARLRKFIYYKLHKQELTYEEQRRVSGSKSAVVAADNYHKSLPVTV